MVYSNTKGQRRCPEIGLGYGGIKLSNNRVNKIGASLSAMDRPKTNQATRTNFSRPMANTYQSEMYFPEIQSQHEQQLFSRLKVGSESIEADEKKSFVSKL